MGGSSSSAKLVGTRNNNLQTPIIASEAEELPHKYIYEAGEIEDDPFQRLTDANVLRHSNMNVN